MTGLSFPEKDTVTGWRNPTRAEEWFGEGAIHYKDFPRKQWEKSDGSLKRWIKCPIDGLRYNRY